MIERMELEPGVAGDVERRSDAAAFHGGAATVVIVPEPTEVVAPQSKPKSRWGVRVAWVVSMTAIGAAVGVLIVMGMKFIDGPVVAKPNQTTLRVLQASATPTPSTNTLSGLYIFFIYPGVFDQVGQLKNDSLSYEQYNISSKSDYSRTIAVAVRKLPSNNVNDDSSYKFRLINPAAYSRSVDKVGTEAVMIMTKNDHTEKTLFWAHKDMILTVSITSNNPKDDLAAFMRLIQSKLRWQQ